jgi:signal transduction histidine kinase
MTYDSHRRFWVLIAGTLLAALLLRFVSTVLAWGQMAEEAFAVQLPYWLLDTIGTAVLLLATAAGCVWLTRRAHRQQHERAHGEHLAQIGLLAGGLAHEIRNTLNAMYSQIALLRKHLSSVDGPACHRIDQIERAVIDLEELVGTFLAFARPAKDQLVEVDLTELLAGLLDFLALDLEQGRVQLRTEMAVNLPPLYADAGKLKRALLNLIINARQAMPEGGTLTVRAWPSERDEVLLEISDTGCGIPEEDQPRVFQTFFSTKPEGTGLGLAIVKRTIEDLGGRITFDSQVGRGTTFRISLPPAQRRRALLERQARSRPQEEPAAVGKETSA